MSYVISAVFVLRSILKVRDEVKQVFAWRSGKRRKSARYVKWSFKRFLLLFYSIYVLEVV